MPKLSIVVPAYNEEEHIEAVAESLVSAREKISRAAMLADVEVIFVDDGSTDGTGEKLDQLQSLHKRELRVVHHVDNAGYGAALKTGFKAATGDFLSFMDADGTIEPASFISMYDALRKNEADMVVGTRFGGGDTKMPWVRKLGNYFFAILLSFLSGQKVRDTASGVRLFKKNLVPLLMALPDGLHFTPAMSTKMLHEQIRIVEVPIPYSERSGDSKLKVFRDGLRFLKIIVSTVLMYNPFKVFFLIGLFCEIVAAGLLSVPLFSLIYEKDVLFSDYIYRSIGGLYFFIAGMQATLFGILARFIVSTFFKRHESGWVIHTINRGLKVYDRMGFYGLAVSFIGLAINALYFWKYLFRGGISLHWAWLLLAAGLIIVGIEMLITGVVMRILKDIKAARDID